MCFLLLTVILSYTLGSLWLVMEFAPEYLNENQNKILAFKDFTKVTLAMILIFSSFPLLLIEHVLKVYEPLIKGGKFTKKPMFGVYLEDEVFLWSCKRGNQKLIQECFDAPDEEQSIRITARDSEEKNGLHLACLKGHTEIVKMFIMKNIFNLLTCDMHGESPLHLACRFVNILI